MARRAFSGESGVALRASVRASSLVPASLPPVLPPFPLPLSPSPRLSLLAFSCLRSPICPPFPLPHLPSHLTLPFSTCLPPSRSLPIRSFPSPPRLCVCVALLHKLFKMTIAAQPGCPKFRLWAKSDQIAAKSATFCRTRATFGRSHAKFGINRQTALDSGPKLLELGRSRDKVARNLPN